MRARVAKQVICVRLKLFTVVNQNGKRQYNKHVGQVLNKQ